MKTKIIVVAIAILTIFSCKEETKNVEPNVSSGNTTNVQDTSLMVGYDRLEAKEIPDNLIQLISEDWMLVTAGNDSAYNTMTASWGGMGYIWERPVSFMFIRDVRYTYEFLEREDSFTLSFFTEEHRGALRICGTKSGRDSDKIKEAGLTPITTPSGLKTFGEARLIVECKKMFVEEMKPESFVAKHKSELLENFYKAETANHVQFISEITNVWIKK